MAELKIYYLANKEGVPFYVGCTSQADLKMRKKVHKHRMKMDLTIHLLDTVNEDLHPQSSLFEEYWIQQMIAWGFPLINQYKTQQGYILTEEHRVKLKEKALKQWSEGRGGKGCTKKGGQ